MKREKGFSLIEMLVVVSLILLLLYTLPSFLGVSNTYKLTTSAQNIASELQTARLLAVSRDEQIRIDYIDSNGNPIDPSTIPPPGPGRNIFVQNNVKGIRVSDSLGNPLRANVGPGNLYQIPSDVTFNDLPQQPIRFSSRGGCVVGDQGFVIGNSTGTIDIKVSSGGRVQIIDHRGGS